MFFSPEAFAATVPRWMAATDDPTCGIRRLPRDRAIELANLAPSTKSLITSLTFDIDRPDAGAAWIDADLGQPNWITQNEANGHAHLGYALAAPIPRSPCARQRPQRYLARIQHAMTVAMRADRAYPHFLTKTPGHPRWRTIWGRRAPYTLDELRQPLPEDLTIPRPIELREAVGEGRNVTLFDSLRCWAYRTRQHYDNLEDWQAACLTAAEGLNVFPAPLPMSEVRSIAKSVARWTWRHITEEGFSAIQAARGRAGGLAGGRIGGRASGAARGRMADEIQRLILLEAI